MLNPIASFHRIRDNFILYVKTAFRTQFQTIEKERERLLRDTKAFHQEPWIEPQPRYPSSGMTVQKLCSTDLPGMSEKEIQDFRELVLSGLVRNKEMELYEHQVQMLKSSLQGLNTVVTSGTGSGKTEAFLLPLFAYLVKESVGWTAPGELPEHHLDWWKNVDWQKKCKPNGKGKSMIRSYRVSQREHETRDAAVRAMIVYPMNALVEDQLSRLRRAIDSDDARRWFDKNRKGNYFYIGRYNGCTPVPGCEHTERGAPNLKKIKELCEDLKSAETGCIKSRKSCPSIRR